MAIQLDFRTLSLTLMLFSLVFGLGMFAYSREHTKFSGIRTMGAGYFLIGGGCVLLGLRHVIYDFLSIVIANIGIIMGVVLIYRGLFRFLGITLRHERWLSTTLVCPACCFTVFLYLSYSRYKYPYTDLLYGLCSDLPDRCQRTAETPGHPQPHGRQNAHRHVFADE